MTVVLITLNVIAGLFLVGVVLLQAGKGADMGAAFGGANPAAFGPAAQGNTLQRITALTAAIFMGSSLALAVVSAREESVFDGTAEPAPIAAPAEPLAPVAIPGAPTAADVAVPAEQPAAVEPVAEAAAAAVGEAAEGVAAEAAEAADSAAGAAADLETPPSDDSVPAAAEEAAPAAE